MDLSPNAYRNGIRNLMIDYLGIGWARLHVLPRGGLLAVPAADLSALYAKAQLDAHAVLDAHKASETCR